MARILIVDDNEMNVDLVERRLRKRGYEVISADSGEDACEKSLRELPDLLLMDIRMPGMNGTQALEVIRSRPETQHIPVIALTADTMAGDREKHLAAGFDDHQDKPINFPELLVKIEAALAKRTARER